MKLLLDTHALIWFLDGDSQLSKNAIEAIENRTNQKYFSHVSLWEITIKVSLGKLNTSIQLDSLIDKVERLGVITLPISSTHILHTKNLPFHHRDPFDRLLIAQAQTEQMTFVTKDRNIEKYDLVCLW